MLVKVHNENVYPYEEKFRGRLISIPAKGYIEMDEDEALYFKASFIVPRRDAQERPDPRYFKKIRVERPPVDPEAGKLICHANGQAVKEEAELKGVLEKFSHMLAGRDEEAEAEKARERKHLKKENKELKDRLARIERLLEEQGFNVEGA